MEKKINLSDETIRLETEYIESERRTIDFLIETCKISINQSVYLRNGHGFLETFSNNEIIGINERERAIPDTIGKLRELKKSVTVDNYESVRNGQISKELVEIKKEVQEISDFVSSNLEKRPRPKDSRFIAYLIYPEIAVVNLRANVRLAIAGCRRIIVNYRARKAKERSNRSKSLLEEYQKRKSGKDQIKK